MEWSCLNELGCPVFDENEIITNATLQGVSHIQFFFENRGTLKKKVGTSSLLTTTQCDLSNHIDVKNFINDSAFNSTNPSVQNNISSKVYLPKTSFPNQVNFTFTPSDHMHPSNEQVYTQKRNYTSSSFSCENLLLTTPVSKKRRLWSMLVSSPNNDRNSPTHGLVGEKFDFNLIQKDYMNRPNVYATMDISNTMTGNSNGLKNSRERSSLPTNVESTNVKNKAPLVDVVKSQDTNRPKEEEFLYTSSETHYELKNTGDKNKTMSSAIANKGNQAGRACHEKIKPTDALIYTKKKSQLSVHQNYLNGTVPLPNCAPYTKQGGMYSSMQNTTSALNTKEKSLHDTRRDDRPVHYKYDKGLSKESMNETNFLKKSSSKPERCTMPLQNIYNDSVQVNIEKLYNPKEDNEIQATQQSTQELSSIGSAVSLQLQEVPMKPEMRKETITEKEYCGKTHGQKEREKYDDYSSHFSHSQYYIKEEKENGDCLLSGESSQFPEKTNTNVNEKNTDAVVPSCNETYKFLFYETQLEIYFGFIGFQIMLVIISFIFSNEAGGLLFLFGFFSALYSHIDRRASAYLLTASILCISAIVLCISVSTGVRGFLPYKEDPTLNIIAIGCLPLCFLFLLHNISLAWQQCHFKEKEKKARLDV